MSYSSNQTALESQLPISEEFPTSPEQLREKLYNLHQRIAFAVNGKIGGLYVPGEKTTGAQYYDSSDIQNNQNVYRMTLFIGALPNVGTTSYPHGISWDSSCRLVQCYGSANKPSTKEWLPFPNQTILVTGDQNNVIITTTANYSTYTDNTVVIEYRRING